MSINLASPLENAIAKAVKFTESQRLWLHHHIRNSLVPMELAQAELKGTPSGEALNGVKRRMLDILAAVDKMTERR